MRNTFTGEGEILCFDAEDTQFYTLKKENFYNDKIDELESRIRKMRNQ